VLGTKQMSGSDAFGCISARDGLLAEEVIERLTAALCDESLFRRDTEFDAGLDAVSRQQ
jgi:hypothetical protein